MKLKGSILINQGIILFILFFLLSPIIIFSQVKDQPKTIIFTDSLSSDTTIVTDTLQNDTIIVTDTISSTNFNDSTNRTNSKRKYLRGYIPDTLFLKTGDKITGKILSFEQGRLKIDGQGPGVVSVKWYKILTISGGNRIFKVEDINGVKYIGQIRFSSDTGEIEIGNKLRYGILLENIIRIFPLEEEWYRGFKGSLGGGANYAKSSDVLTINSQYNLYYVVSKWRFINDFSLVSTKKSNEDASVRIQTNLQALYALPKRWVLSEINSFNRNDELGVRSRISFGGGGGNNIVQTDWQRLLILSGIIVNLEKDIESNNVISNLEWPLTLHHTIYKFAKPNLSSNTSITSYVGITEKGRIRVDASTDLTWEFVTNFKLQLSYYYNFDNKNIVGKNTKEDHGIVLSLLLDLK